MASGKVTVWDGKAASQKFAKFIIAKLKDLKNIPENKIEMNKKSPDKKPESR